MYYLAYNYESLHREKILDKIVELMYSLNAHGMK